MTQSLNAAVLQRSPRFPALVFAALYRVVYPVFCVASLPHFWQRARRSGEPSKIFAQRFGNYSAFRDFAASASSVAWVHAVSVGEVMACKEWIRRFIGRTPSARIVLTTVTPTGQKVAQELAGERIAVCYAPLEFSFAVRKFLDVFQPKLLLLMETELWPNLILQSARAGIPIGMLNARLSERSCRRYTSLRNFLKAVFDSIQFVLTQTEEDGERFKRLGFQEDRVHVLGNMKFDNVSLESVAEEEIQSFRKLWGITSEDRIWLAGSTHPGEDEVFLRAFQQVRKRVPKLRAVIAPRHTDRTPAILALAASLQLTVSRTSERKADSKADVIVLDEMGILKKVYALAELVWMGGSWIRHGGQNPIEPAALRKPILFSPHVFNFKNVYATLKRLGGALCVETEEAMVSEATRLLEDRRAARLMGDKAFGVVESFQGATRDHLDYVFKNFSWLNEERVSHGQSTEKFFSPSGGRV